MHVQGRVRTGRGALLALRLAGCTAALAAIAVGAAHAAPASERQLTLGDRSSRIAQEARAAEARVSARQAEARAAARASGNGADLAIWAYADNPVPTSEGLTIFVAIENWGPQAATNVTFKVVLPEGVTGASPKPSPSPGITCAGPAPAERTVTCSVATIAVEDFVEVEIGATAPATDGVRTGTAEITAQTPADPWPGDNSTSYDIEVRSDADLAIWQEAPPVAVNAEVTFEVLVANSGPKAAKNVVITDKLPEGHALRPGGLRPSAGTTCTPGTGTFTCHTATLARGDMVEVTVVVEGSPTHGTLRNEARVSAEIPDPDLDDNEDVQIAVVGNPDRADLAVEADGPWEAAADTSFTYLLFVDNLGPQPAKGVVVTNKLPAGVTYESYQITRSQPPQGTPPPPLGTCTHAGGTVTCQLGEVAADSWADIQVRVRPGSGAVGAITNIAEVAAESPLDHDPDSNRSKVRTLVHPAGTVDLGVYAEGPESAPVGTSFSYYVAVDNYGPAALAPTLTAVLPAGVTFQSVTPATGCAYTASSRTLTCVLAALQPWDWHELEISVLPTAPGNATTTLNVSGGTETDPSDNAASVVTKVLGHVLSVQTTGPGTVTSTPVGIACGTDCSEAYPEGANVTLVASPTAGSSFLGWSGACTGTASTCIVAMTEQRAVTAAFGTPPPPPPPPDITAPGVTIKISPPRLALALKNGVPVRLACNEACQARVQLKLAAATAARLKLPAVVGTASKALAAGAASKVTVKLKPAAKRKLAKLRSVRLTLVVTAKDAAGNVRTASKGLTLRR